MAAPAAAAGTRLRTLLAALPTRGSSLAMPGAFNGLVARAVAQVGFEATYVSGAGVAAGMGLPDVGLAGAEDFCRVIRDVATCSGLPLLADADTAFGEGSEVVQRVVCEYVRAGAGGLHLEDQVFPKRCGHLDGKALVPAENFAMKIQAAARVRDEEVAGSGFVLCARTDARGVEGLESTISRAQRYVDAGADMIFPEGLASLEEFEAVAKALRGYNGINGGQGPFLLANMTEFGKTPLTSATRMGELGYHCTIFPMTLFRRAMRGVLEGLEELKTHGQVRPETLAAGALLSREETYELLGYTPSMPWHYPSANRQGGQQRTRFKQPPE